jgi:hypothetical protein
MTPTVDIKTSGRGGQIFYREGDHTITFDWEFAMSPALALVWGPARADWDKTCPWAAGRQASICDFVGAEVVRQQAPGGAFECDLDRGELTILTASGARARHRAD